MKSLLFLLLLLFPFAVYAAPALESVVVPVILVAADYTDKENEIKVASHDFESIVRYTQAWYRAEAGATFKLWPLRIVHSSLSAKEWIALSEKSRVIKDRYTYLQEVQKEAEQLVPVSDHLQYVISVFAGVRPDLTAGAAENATFAVVPPLGTSIKCPVFTNNGSQPLTDECAESVYATAHELGHAFGLSHSCEADGFPENPDCEQSVMSSKHPPGMILLEQEKTIIFESGFFSKKN